MATEPPSTIAIHPPPLHALVIGIDKYPKVTQLSGAVSDAKAIEQYLTNKLGVATDQITTLHDQQATRKAIIDSFNAIKSNTLINKGDPILIYFAGHGASTRSPPGWDSISSEVQFVVPFDYGLTIDGVTVSPLPDRTIGVLLDRIAEEKGDNITVIFDCCHSGSGSRDPLRLDRGLKEPVTMSSDLDRDIWGTGRKAKISSGFLNKGLRSHVLLAACSSQETAKEADHRGVFTTTLIKALETTGTDFITYTELIHQIGSLEGGKQNPQCEGENRERRLFDTKTNQSQRGLYRVENRDDEYVIMAGSVHGIFEGSRFEVYTQHPGIAKSTAVGILVANKPEDFTTVMAIPDGCALFKIDGPAFALQLSYGNDTPFRIHVEGQKLQNVLLSCIEKVGMKTSNTPTDPKTILSIAMEDGNLVFHILDKRSTARGATQIPFCIPFDISNPLSSSFYHLERVLRAAAHYYRHFGQESRTKNLSRDIQVQFNKLEESSTTEQDLGLQPVGPDLIKDREIDLVVDEDMSYGLKIVNRSHRPLYPFVLFFSSGLSIECYYRPGISGGRADVPLPPKESITIGYGAAGGAPISFTLDSSGNDYDKGFQMKKLDKDVGFFKIYLSTVQIDLSDLQQESPFGPIQPNESIYKPEQGGRRPKRDGFNSSNGPAELWDAIVIPIVERRFPMSIFERFKRLIKNKIRIFSFLS